MLQSAKIKIRSLKELQADNLEHIDIIVKTPFKKRKKPNAASTTKKLDDKNGIVLVQKAPPKSCKKICHSSLKDLPATQKRIDSFFKSCQKTYKIEPFQVEPPTPIAKNNTKQQKTTPKTKRNCATTKNTTSSTQRRNKTGRKRLFVEPETETSCSYDSKKAKMIDCITIDSDSEDVADNPNSTSAKGEGQKNTNLNATPTLNQYPIDAGCSSSKKPQTKTRFKSPSSLIKHTSTCLKKEETTPGSRSPSPNENSTANSSINYQQFTKDDTFKAAADKENSRNASSVTPNSSRGQQISYTSSSKSKTPLQSSSSACINTVTKRKSKPCPPYKIIEGTTFAVDAFQFGYIENVSHYFLTHFHADHYIGLTRKFSMPLYMSSITARFVRTFIPIDDELIHELELNQPHKIDNIEITALNANHCPGAVLLVFKFLDTGKCILHTGDFRASYEMESEPIFWNNDIHTIYLDTTYISNKYDFCTQDESIEKAKHLIETFQEKHHDKRILYICGSYVIGKEKFWSNLAENYRLKVWTEGNRYKAVKAMEDETLDRLLIDDPYQANMHIIPMAKLGYLHLVEYFSQYEQHYDIVFAIRPSGWEKKSKPQYRGKINIIGIEYSEHSSFSEMQRFVKYLKPQHVLSTVPTCNDLMVTAKIPHTWYKYDTLKSSSNYQPSIDTYFKQTPLKRNVQTANLNIKGFENFVSPLSLANTGRQNQSIMNNDDRQQVISIHSSENASEQEPLLAVNKKAAKETEIDKPHDLENLEIPPTNPKRQCNKKITKKSPANQENNNNTIKISTAAVTQNSSEDFERSEILSTVKKKPLNKNAKSKLKINIKKKLLFEEANTKLKQTPKNSSASRVAKLKYQEQITRTTTSDEDFEIPQTSKRMPTKQIIDLPSKNEETEKSVTSFSDSDTKLPITQKLQANISNKKTKNHYEKQKSLPNTFGEESEVRSSQRVRKNNQNSLKPKSFQNKEVGEANTKLNEIPKNSLTSRVTKLKYQEQIRITTSSDEDFEIPQTAKRMNLTFKQINNMPFKNEETQNSFTTFSDHDAELPITQKPHANILNGIVKNHHDKQNSLATTSGEEKKIRHSQRVRINNHNPLKTTDFQNIEHDRQLEDTLLKLSKQTQLSITKNTKMSNSQQQSAINPLFKSSTTSNCSSSTDEIPSSQTNLQTSWTLRNKRKSLPQPAHAPTLIKNSIDWSTADMEQKISLLYPKRVSKITSDESLSSVEAPPLKNNQKSKDVPIVKTKQQLSSTPINGKILLNEILYNNSNIDIYNSSQLAAIVEQSLSKQCLDTSTDHIPRELLSDPDADEDWMD